MYNTQVTTIKRVTKQMLQLTKRTSKIVSLLLTNNLYLLNNNLYELQSTHIYYNIVSVTYNTILLQLNDNFDFDCFDNYFCDEHFSDFCTVDYNDTNNTVLITVHTTVQV